MTKPVQWSFCNPSCLIFYLAILIFRAVRIILGWVGYHRDYQFLSAEARISSQRWPNVGGYSDSHYPHHQLVQPSRQVLMVELIVNVSFHLETTLLDLVVQPSWWRQSIIALANLSAPTWFFWQLNKVLEPTHFPSYLLCCLFISTNKVRRSDPSADIFEEKFVNGKRGWTVGHWTIPLPLLAFLQKILSEDARQSCPNYFRFSADCKENNPKQF